MKVGRKSQISMFVIVGMLIVIIIGSYFLIRSASVERELIGESEDLANLPATQSSLDAFIKACVEDTAIEAEKLYGLHMVYSTPLIKEYITSALPTCFNGFGNFRRQGFEVAEGNLFVDAEITRDALVAEIDYPVTFTRGDTVINFKEESYTFPRAVTERLNFNSVTRVVSADGSMVLEVPAGTRATVNGERVKEVGLKLLDREFNALDNSVVAGMLAFSGIPHGARFSQPVKVTFFYEDRDIPITTREEDIRLGYYDNEIGVWVGLPTEVDAVNNRITTYTTHFSQLATVTQCNEDGASATIITPTLVQQDCSGCEEGWVQLYGPGATNGDRSKPYTNKLIDIKTGIGIGSVGQCIDSRIGEIPGTSTVSRDFFVQSGLYSDEDFTVEVTIDKSGDSDTAPEEDSEEVLELGQEACEPFGILDQWDGTSSSGTPMPGHEDREFGCKEPDEIEENGEVVGWEYTCFCDTYVYYHSIPTSSEIEASIEPKPTPPQEKLYGYGEHTVKFKGEGNACVSAESPVTERAVDISEKKLTVTASNDDIEATVGVYTCTDGDDCKILPQEDIEIEDWEFTFGVEVISPGENEACMQSTAVVDISGVGVQDADYYCNEELEGRLDFVRGTCMECIRNSGESAESDLAYKWTESNECFTNDDVCPYTFEGVLKQAGDNCQICKDGKWVSSTQCSSACSAEEELYEDLPVTGDVVAVTGGAITDITGRQTGTPESGEPPATQTPEPPEENNGDSDNEEDDTIVESDYDCSADLDGTLIGFYEGQVYCKDDWWLRDEVMECQNDGEWENIGGLFGNCGSVGDEIPTTDDRCCCQGESCYIKGDNECISGFSPEYCPFNLADQELGLDGDSDDAESDAEEISEDVTSSPDEDDGRHLRCLIIDEDELDAALNSPGGGGGGGGFPGGLPPGATSTPANAAGGSGNGGGRGGNVPCYTGGLQPTCSGVTVSLPQTITLDTTVDTRDTKMCDAFGDLSAGNTVTLQSLTQRDDGSCYVLGKLSSEIDGYDRLYFKLNQIEHLLDNSCEDDSECGEGLVCVNSVCTPEDEAPDIENVPVVGFFNVPVDDFEDAEDIGAFAVGINNPDENELADALDEAGALDLFVKIDDTAFRTAEDKIDFDKVDFSDADDDRTILGYWIIDDVCSWDVTADNLEQLYDKFREENGETAVMMNFDDLSCADGLVEDAGKQFFDIGLFNVDLESMPDENDDSFLKEQDKIAGDIKDKFSETSFMPVIHVFEGAENNMPDAGWVSAVGSAMSGFENFNGLIYSPWSALASETKTIKDIKDTLGYANAFGETLCEAGEDYLDEECDFTPEQPPGEIKVAFIANQGTGTDAGAVLELIKEEGAVLIMSAGNLGMASTPAQWESMINDSLDDGFAVGAVVGSEDTDEWGDYKLILNKRNDRIVDIECDGEFGDQGVCDFHNLKFVMTGVGISFEESEHGAFISDELATSEKPWNICVFHKSNHNMRLGGKQDSDTLAKTYYDTCRENGALIITGYENTYARTKTVTNFTDDGGDITGDNDKLTVGREKTFAAVTGLGGNSLGSYNCTLHDGDDWWASIFTSNYYLENGIQHSKSCTSDTVGEFNYGALFITFNSGEDDTKAVGEFKTIDGTVVDTFTITRETN